MGFPGSGTISKVPSHYSGKQSFRHHSAVAAKNTGSIRHMGKLSSAKAEKAAKDNNHLEQPKFFINIGGGYTNSKVDSL
jgi:hypothetical protein